MRGLKIVIAVALVIGLSGLAPAARAQSVTIIGNSFASQCSHDAIVATRTKTLPGPVFFSDCTVALETEHLLPHDQAGTFVNRGVLFLCESDYTDARSDFEQAIKIKPELAESYVNRGAAKIAGKQYKEAIEDFDYGLSLNPAEPQVAYYDRAIAREDLNDLKGAYEDYMEASQLAPDWDMPKHELERFQVKPAPQG